MMISMLILIFHQPKSHSVDPGHFLRALIPGQQAGQALVLASASGCDLRVYSFSPRSPSPVRVSQGIQGPVLGCEQQEYLVKQYIAII